MFLQRCKGIGRLHWDEISIQKGVKTCVRANELIGFEDISIPESLTHTNMFEPIIQGNFKFESYAMVKMKLTTMTVIRIHTVE